MEELCMTKEDLSRLIDVSECKEKVEESVPDVP
jgi:hypothetical protein